MDSFRVFFRLMFSSIAIGRIISGESHCDISETDRGVSVNCSHQRRSYIPNFLLNATKIDLRFNNIVRVKNNSFRHLLKLEYLYLSHNEISCLEPMSFEDCVHLLLLDLSHNGLHLPSIPDVAFDNLLHLRSLNLKHNNIHLGNNLTYPERCFRNLKELEILEIDVYGSPNFGIGIGNLTGLKSLVLGGKHCTIKQLTKEIFKPFDDIALESLDISSCNISSIAQDVFEPLKKLTKLKLKYSRVGVKQGLHTLSSFVGRDMDEIDFHKIHTPGSSNDPAVVRINESLITSEDVQYLRGICVKNFTLSHNLILSIQSSSLRNSRFSNCIRGLFLSVNSFVYEHWFYLMLLSSMFKNIVHLDVSSQVHVMKAIPRMYLADLDNKTMIRCDNQTNLHKVQNVSIPLPATLTNLNLAALTYDFSNLIGNIYIPNSNNLTNLNMSFIGLAEVCYEIHGLYKVNVLDLSGNPKLSLKDSFFETFPNVSSLHMNYFSFQQYVVSEQGKTLLKPLTKLRKLYISTNRLKNLPRRFFSSNPLLEYVDLSNNLFSIIPFSIHLTPFINTIDIRFNLIEYIDYRGRLQIDKHIHRSGNHQLHLWLEGNDLLCDCTSFNFMVWLKHTKAVFDKRGKYNCFLSNGEKSTIAKEITDEGSLQLWRKCIGMSLFYMVLTVFIMTLATVSVALLVKTNKTVLLNTINHLFDREFPKPKRADFRRDVYISYAEDDYQWVCHHLCPALERRRLSLFIWDRDSVPGDSIPDQIVENVHSCWKVLLYYTDNFHQDPWTYMSVMAAINSVDDNSPEKVLLLLPEDENPRLPNCLLEVIPESCIVRVPDGSCYQGSEDLWDTISNKVKEE